MPTYEYACTACGRHVEVHQRLNDEPLTTCEACGGRLRKVFHAAGIVFKGSGFYATDSRSKKSEGASSSSSSSGSSTSSGTSTSSGSESAAAPAGGAAKPADAPAKPAGAAKGAAT